MIIRSLALLCLLITPLVSLAQPAPRLDHYGDPLPEGAVARLGTLRLMHPAGIAHSVAPTGRIASVAVSPDGKLAASGQRQGLLRNVAPTSGDKRAGSIYLWHTATGKRYRKFETPDTPVGALYFSPDGDTLFAGCGGYVCAWQVSTGKLIWANEAIDGQPRNLASRFRTVDWVNRLFGSFSIPVEKLMLVEGKLIALYAGHFHGGDSFHYQAQKAVRFFDSKTGELLPLPSTLESTVWFKSIYYPQIPRLFYEVAIAPNANCAAVVVGRAERKEGMPGNTLHYADRRLEIINVAANKIAHTFADDKAILASLTFTADGSTLALRAGTEIWLIATATGKKTVLVKDVPDAVDRLLFTDNNQLAARMADGVIRAWNLTTGKPIERHSVRELDFLPARGGKVVADFHGSAVRLFDADSGKPLHRYDAHAFTPLIRFALHSKNTLISRDKEKAYLWDTRTWTVKQTVPIPGERLPDWRFRIHNAEMDRWVSLEKQTYIIERDKFLELRDTTANRLLHTLKLNADDHWIYFSPTGNRLAVYDGFFFHFVDTATGKSLAKVPNPSGEIQLHPSPVLSTYGKYFARVEPKSNEIDVFDVDSGKRLQRFNPNAPDEKRGVNRLHFSQDEQILFSECYHHYGGGGWGARHKIIVLTWDLKTGQPLQEIVVWPDASAVFRHPRLNALALSNDRRTVAVTHHHTNTIELWEVASGTKRAAFTGHVRPIVDLAFSPDNRHLVSSSDDTTLLVWDMNRPLQSATFKERLNEQELAAHWQALLQPDATKADVASWSLVHAAQDSLPFLRKQLRPVARPDEQRVRQWLDALDNDNFKVRSKAEADLERLGELALEQLETALRQKNTLEKHLRLEALLHKAQKAARPFGTAERMRQWRALEVLERIGTPGAAQLVRELAGGAPGAQLTTAARATLARLESE